MKIVVLDGHTANPGDLSWDEFAKLGNLEIFPRTGKDQIISRLQRTRLSPSPTKPSSTRNTLSALPNLRYIGVTSHRVQYRGHLKPRANAASVVANVPEYSTQESRAGGVCLVAAELTNRTGYHAETVRAGRWSKSEDFATGIIRADLSGRTLTRHYWLWSHPVRKMGPYRASLRNENSRPAPPLIAKDRK